MSAAERLAAAVRSGAGRPQPGICTAAFSGGADSTALLLCLWQMREELAIDLRAVHVHHGIRGAEADRDAAFCAKLCEKYGIPFQLVHVDVPAYAKEHRLSVETAARRLRYEALEQAAPEGEIAAAHHAGDNAETVLFHLLRGSGLRGLRGILPRSGRIIRPLLTVEKPEILAFLRECGESYVEDSTNFLPDSSRNRLRTELMPLLLRENPAFLKAAARTAASLTEDEAFLTGEAKAAYQRCFDPIGGGFHGLADYAKPIRMRVYMLRLEQMPKHIDPSYEMLSAIDEALLCGSGTVNLSGDVYARVHRGILYMQAHARPAAPVPFRIGENRIFPEKLCFVTCCEGDSLSRNLHTADTKKTLDFDKIKGRLIFRPCSPQDRLTLPGREFSSLLKKQIQALVPAPERETLHILYDDLGCVWCERIGTAARVKPDADSRRILIFEIRAAEN